MSTQMYMQQQIEYKEVIYPALHKFLTNIFRTFEKLKRLTMSRRKKRKLKRKK